VGVYTYYEAPDRPKQFAARDVLYHDPFVGDQSVTGKFCPIAQKVRFIMHGANLEMSGVSNYPFQIFG
jgi:virginiamycin A acetyltransferase